nr:endonuclease domain-containing protein [Streptomyces sp. NRRL S-340]
MYSSPTPRTSSGPSSRRAGSRPPFPSSRRCPGLRGGSNRGCSAVRGRRDRSARSLRAPASGPADPVGAARGRTGRLSPARGRAGPRETGRRAVGRRFRRCPPFLSPASPEHVDHCHGTGRVRGVLCFSCNAALGQFKDRPDVMRRAAAYVEGIAWKPTLVAPGVYQLPS